ncbi:MAG: class I SAM-dependent methyltransferase [Parcubacteria group bacterium]|jgi:ubiquinone/menaquinone biosynthesis C-methylase UbiE
MNQIEQVKKESIEEFSSDNTQEQYSKIAEKGLWESEEILINKFFKPSSNILDIGCGSGRTTFPLYEMGYKVIGVDITPVMVEIAKKVASDKGANISFLLGDATKLDFEDNHFDGAIFANNGWVQIPGKENRQKALNEIYRVLKPGSYFILTAHQRYYSGSYLFLWIKNWIKFYMLKPLGFNMKEIDFGDYFFERNYKINNKAPKQFIHCTSQKEMEEQIAKSGFKLEMRKKMGELSEQDAQYLRGSLSKDFNSFKSPIFYICAK